MDPHPLDRPSAAEVARKAIKQRRIVWKEILTSAAGNPRRKSGGGGGGDFSARFHGADYEGGRNSRPASASSACSKNAVGKSKHVLRERFWCYKCSLPRAFELPVVKHMLPMPSRVGFDTRFSEAIRRERWKLPWHSRTQFFRHQILYVEPVNVMSLGESGREEYVASRRLSLCPSCTMTPRLSPMLCSKAANLTPSLLLCRFD